MDFDPTTIDACNRGVKQIHFVAAGAAVYPPGLAAGVERMYGRIVNRLKHMPDKGWRRQAATS